MTFEKNSAETTMMIIDATKLPENAQIDASILIGALDREAAATDREACKAFLAEMLRQNKDVLIAAPTIAEFYRGGRPGRALPSVQNIVVLPFDERAAMLLAEKFPAHVVQRFKRAESVPSGYIKFDAMIVACGAARKAACFVSDDATQLKLASEVGLRTARPREFEQSRFEKIEP